MRPANTRSEGRGGQRAEGVHRGNSRGRSRPAEKAMRKAREGNGAGPAPLPRKELQFEALYLGFCPGSWALFFFFLMFVAVLVSVWWIFVPIWLILFFLLMV